MATRDEHGFIRYTPEELERIPPYEIRSGGGPAAGGLAAPPVGTLVGATIGAGFGPVGAFVGGVAGAALGGAVAAGVRPGAGMLERR